MQIHKLEHVQSEELPKEWRNRLNSRQDEHYTVFLLPERSEQPLIGLWVIVTTCRMSMLTSATLESPATDAAGYRFFYLVHSKTFQGT